MDRELSSSFKKKRRLKILTLIGLSVVMVVALIAVGRILLQPTIKRGSFDIVIAQVGTVEETIAASGLVVPEYEYLITSPIHSKIERVLLHAGEAVEAGEPILQLYLGETQNDYNKLLDEQAANYNRAEQLKLNLEGTLTDINTQYIIKQMSIQNLETGLDHERELLKIGGSTDEKVKQASLNLEISRLELRQLQSKLKNQEKVLETDRNGLGYQISIQHKSITAYSKKLDAAALRSPAKGVVTWVNGKIGAEVAEGADIARVADLSSYKIQGKINDSYAAQLKTGRTVIAKIEDQELRGIVTNIQPEVEDGTVKFFVSLHQNNHSLLRANLKVDLYLVTSLKQNVLRVRNGPAFTGADQQQLFVVKGKELLARTVNIGISNYEFTEILSGLQQGEEVVITELKDQRNLQKVIIED